jgi:hypothetical protein
VDQIRGGIRIAMTFSSFRNKVRWVALISALILFSLDMYCRKYCYQIIIGSGMNGPVPFKIDRTPYGFMVVWASLLLITLLSGLITLPRWQSFVALLTVGLVTFLWLMK